MFKRLLNRFVAWLAPEYVLSDQVYIRGFIEESGAELKTWITPNHAMRPVSKMARLRVWLWKRRLPPKATSAQIQRYRANFKQFIETEMHPIPNSIKEPTIWKPKPGLSARWYDHKSNVMPMTNLRKD